MNTLKLRPQDCLLALAVVAGVGWSGPALGQSGHARPVVVVLPDRPLEGDPRALILRDADKDVIVLSPAVSTARTLAPALGLLRYVRVERPQPDGNEVLTVTGFVQVREHRPALRQAILAAARRLEAARVTTIGNLGTGRWIRLPAALVGG